MSPLLGSLILLEYLRLVAYLGHVALLGSLILMKYFKAGGLFGACRPGGIFDSGEVLRGLWPITLVHVALVGYFILLRALLCRSNCISATEILNFDKIFVLISYAVGLQNLGPH